MDAQCSSGDLARLPFIEQLLWVLILSVCGLYLLGLFSLYHLRALMVHLRVTNSPFRENSVGDEEFKDVVLIEDVKDTTLAKVKTTTEEVSEVRNTLAASFPDVIARVVASARDMERQTTDLGHRLTKIALDVRDMQPGLDAMQEVSESHEARMRTMDSLTESVESLLKMHPERHLSREQ